ncbi:unnamed protein product [Diabrotica balteata]|uniref:Uncharacterized protein n=1 Tax=Diabrotica balteata TaxID=107213 RepID=A0A9N9SKK0_DIABA|nr:unnamed protein product [Diabrotica balteata]
MTDWLTAQNINFVPERDNPPNVPQARLIEEFWAILSQMVYYNGWKAQNEDRLRRRILQKFREIDLEPVQRLIADARPNLFNEILNEDAHIYQTFQCSLRTCTKKSPTPKSLNFFKGVDFESLPPVQALWYFYPPFVINPEEGIHIEIINMIVTNIKLKINLLFSTAYKSKMVDIMTNDKSTQLITSRKDALKHSFKFGAPSQFSLQLMKHSYDPLDVALVQTGLVIDCGSAKECLDRIAFQKDIMTIKLLMPLQSLIPKMYLDSNGRSLFYITDTDKHHYQFSIYFQKGHHLYDIFNTKLMGLKDSGIVDFLYKKYKRNYTKAMTLANLLFSTAYKSKMVDIMTNDKSTQLITSRKDALKHSFKFGVPGQFPLQLMKHSYDPLDVALVKKNLVIDCGSAKECLDRIAFQKDIMTMHLLMPLQSLIPKILLFSTAYKSKMVDIMTNDKSTQLITSKEDAIKHSFKFGVPGQFAIQLMKRSHDPLDIALFQKGLIIDCGSLVECLDRVAFQKDMMTMRLLMPMQSLLPRMYLDSNGRSLFYVTDTVNIRFHFSIYFQKGHHLYDIFNTKLMGLKDSGIVDFLYKKYKRNYTKAMTLAKIEKVSVQLILAKMFVCDCANLYSNWTNISSLEKCVSYILKSTVDHKDIVYLVNTDLKISHPAIYINTEYEVNLILQQEPTVYILTGNIDGVITQLFNNSLLNPRAKFILVQSTINNKTDIFNHYFLRQVLIIEYKMEERDYQLFKCTAESCYVTEDSCYKTYINGTIFDISQQGVWDKLDVVWTLHAPYIITPTTGVHMKIINLIATHMNLKLNYIHTPYPVVPLAIDPLFRRNEYDMCSIQFTNLTKQFDKTIDVTEDMTVYIIPRIIVTKELKMFYLEFETLIWYHFLILILILFVLFKIINALIPKTDVISAFDVILGVLLEGVTSMNARIFSLKILLINYILFCLLFSTAYKSKMFDVMKTDLSSQLISTTEDLLKYEFKVALPTEYVKLFKMSQDPFDTIIVANNRIVNCLNFTICLNRVAFQKDVVTTRLLRPTQALIPQYYLDSEGRSLLYIIKRPFSVPYYFSLLFRKGHPLFEEFNKNIFLLKQAGFVDYLIQNQQRSYEKAIALANIKSSFRYSALNLKILQSTFFVYFLGNVTKILPLLNELSVLNSRGLFIIICTAINHDEKYILDKYFIQKVYIIVKNEDANMYEVFQCSFRRCLNKNIIRSCLGFLKNIKFQNLPAVQALWSFYPPFVINSEEGIHIELINIIASTVKLKINYTISLHVANPFEIDPEFCKGSYDIFINAIVFPSPLFDNTYTFTEDVTVMVFPVINVNNNWKLFYGEFHLCVWGCFLGLILLLCVIFKMFSAFTNKISILNIIVGGLLGVTQISTRKVSMRILILNYSIFGLLFTTVYKSKMVDIMRSDQSTQLLTSKKDALKYLFKFGAPGQSSIDLMKYSQNPVDVALLQKDLIINCVTSVECVNRTAFQKDIMSMKLLKPLQSLLPTLYLDSNGRSLLYVSNMFEYHFYFSIYFKKSHYLFNIFNTRLMNLKDNGVVDYLYKKYKRNYTKAMTLAKLKNVKGYSNLTLKTFQTTFYAYIIFVIFSLFVFTVEIFLGYKSTKKLICIHAFL